jgi:predicted nucleic acid-binding protein
VALTMSLRPDMVREQAQAFSLNQYFSVGSAHPHAPMSAISPPLAAPQSTAAAPRGANNGLNFTISAQTLGTRFATAGVATHAAAPAMASGSTKSSMPPLSFTLTAPRQNINTSLSAVPHGGDSQRRIPAGYVHGGIDNSGEVMRLTALLEDTRVKLDRAHTKLTASETSVCRANNALVSERATANARMSQMAVENKALKELEVRLRTELKNTPSATQALHDAERFRMQAEGAVQMEEQNESLRRSLNTREAEMVAAKDTMNSLSIEHQALKSSYDQVSACLGEAIAKHTADVETLQAQMQAAGTPETRVDTAALAACQQAADSRLAAELAAMEQISKNAMHLAVEVATESANTAMRTKMEAKLEATEKRNAIAEKKLYQQLERANEERDVAHQLAEKHETRARLAEEFVVATASAATAREGAPVLDAAAATPVMDAVETTTEQAVSEDNQIALSEYETLRAHLEAHSLALEDDPHSVRKQMRTAAIARRCREMGNAMILGHTAPKRYATADIDTGIGCCSQRSAVKGDADMNTKAYATCAIPYIAEDMGGAEIMTAVHTGGHTQTSTASTQSHQQRRIEGLIGATKQDLTKALQFQTLVHKLNAGTIQMVKVDATGNSTACAPYTETVVEKEDSMDEEPDLIQMS